MAGWHSMTFRSSDVRLPGFLQDRVGHADLSYVVHGARGPQLDAAVEVPAEMARDQRARAAHALDVLGGLPVPEVTGKRQATECRLDPGQPFSGRRVVLDQGSRLGDLFAPLGRFARRFESGQALLIIHAMQN